MLDEAATALGKGAEVETVSGEEFHGRATAILGTRGAFTGRSSGGMAPLQSVSWYRRDLGAYLVRAPFCDEYVQDSGGGFPIDDGFEYGLGFVRQDFDWGSLRYDTSLADMAIILEPHVELEFGISF